MGQSERNHFNIRYPARTTLCLELYNLTTVIVSFMAEADFFVVNETIANAIWKLYKYIDDMKCFNSSQPEPSL